MVALSTGEEAYSTALERTLAHIRDSKDYNFPANLAGDVIAPSASVQALMDQRPTATVSALEAPRSATKTTTAAAFFGKKKEGDKPASKGSAKTSAKTTATKGRSNSKPTVASMFQRAASSNKPKVQQDEKENNKRPKTVGNADDFVADEEESDDEEEVVAKPAIVRGRDAPDQAMVDDVDEEMKEEEEEEKTAKPTIYGAMDDFAKPKEKTTADTTKRRRRRKKLVTKTSTDKNGYLHTETQEVWGDIPTDEEEEDEAPKKVKPAPSRPKKKVVKPSGMKQGKLNSFFKPK